MSFSKAWDKKTPAKPSGLKTNNKQIKEPDTFGYPKFDDSKKEDKK